MQRQYKLEEVDMKILAEISDNRPTTFFVAMGFQLGCAIGELVRMGTSREQLLSSCIQLIDESIKTHLSVNTKSAGV